MKAAFALQFLFATATAALAQPSSLPNDLNIPFEALGKKYELRASEEALKNSIWDNQIDENPPVSAKKATKLADEVRQSLAKDDGDRKWKLSCLCLVPFGEKWVWTVTYQAFSRELPEANELIFVAVLMDGTVIKPKITDDK